MLWKDKKVVSMNSSLYSNTTFINKNKKNIPTIVHEYNKYLASVDRFISNYRILQIFASFQQVVEKLFRLHT